MVRKKPLQLLDPLLHRTDTITNWLEAFNKQHYALEAHDQGGRQFGWTRGARLHVFSSKIIALHRGV